MVKNKSLLYLSMVFFIISIILHFPFPHRYPFGEVIFTNLNIPIRFSGGFHTVGIMTSIILIIGLFLLINSVKKYYGRIVLVTILCFFFVPSILISAYQSTFATGIYAVSYEGEEARCEFDMIDEETLHAECELSFKNHSNADVTFALEFYEEWLFEDDLQIVSLMNNYAPYEVVLSGKESKQIKLTTNIDVSKMEEHIESGTATGIDIIVQSEGNKREL